MFAIFIVFLTSQFFYLLANFFLALRKQSLQSPCGTDTGTWDCGGRKSGMIFYICTATPQEAETGGN